MEVYESTADLREALLKKLPLHFAASQPAALTITVDDATTYQQMDGFGASITDASAWLLFTKLNPAQRQDIMEKLFDPRKGIGLSLVRQPMGSSDFAREDYSYDDLPRGLSDPNLSHFSVDRDRTCIIPVLRQALDLNPQLKVMATPWSPPGWMKTSGSMIGGRLLSSAYAPYAKYFVKFVQAYSAAGIPIYAVTMQNEPLYIPTDYPGMGMSANQQTVFLRDYLAPAFHDAGLKTKILIFDHNWDLIKYPEEVLRDSKAAAYADGIATHCYGGEVSAQTVLHRKFTDKPIWMTECSGGEWQSGPLLKQQVGLIIGVTRNWGKSVILWNLALDQDHGPHLGGCKDCRGVVTVNYATSNVSVTTTVDYVALGHASKFVMPGASRIDSNTFAPGNLDDVAFLNPDGSIVLIVLNPKEEQVSFEVRWRQRSFSYTLLAGAVVTFHWTPTVRQQPKSND